MNAKERAKLWRQNNRERHRAYSRNYYREHREACLSRILDYQKGYRMTDAGKEVAKRYNQNHPDYKRFNHHLRRYGITPEIYEQMIMEQGGKCAICGRTENSFGKSRRLHIDHCHQSTEVRGLLCGRCNMMLGGAEDNPETLIRAAEYLTRQKKCRLEVA